MIARSKCQHRTFVNIVYGLKASLSAEIVDGSHMELKRDSVVLLNPIDYHAYVTANDIFCERSASQGIRRLLSLVKSNASISRIHHSAALGRGVVVAFRSQKIIVLDRMNGLVYIILRVDDPASVRLLENELDASRVLPSVTIPVIHSGLEKPPYFIVQPYFRFKPSIRWRTLINSSLPIFDHLCDFYKRHGLTRVDADIYLDNLIRSISKGIHWQDAIIMYPKIGAARELIVNRIRSELDSCDDRSVYITRVHGDFIASHVRQLVKPAYPHFVLMDWSESHRSSIFHDVFYFQFQNGDTDFWEQFDQLGQNDYQRYFGRWLEQLLGFLQSQAGLSLSFKSIRFNLLLGFLQELHHRVQRLDHRYIPFWIGQCERLLHRRLSDVEAKIA